ncbi:zinc finger BED domain-containing protein RICESLEEPER 2-like [Canna indica]|uniref:Zinc finger BED domain-containing protein RICESLEEPER 2-like n=1 Tax=Canna indica TaxID=4628 RepID=A0AAQ3QI10_9LILI|nr:zinc finger BED domain-containing protein RICESLEEPER 2-like [Canna indica]
MSNSQEEAESNTVAAVAQPISTPASDESGNEIEKTTLPPKGPKQRSKVWEYFEVYVDKEKGEIKGKCKYCQKEYAVDTKKNGTSALNYHAKTCKKISGNEDKTQSQLSLQPSGDDESTGMLSTWKFDQAAIRKSLARMKIVDELPFKFVECEGFKEFMHNACPRFKFPSRWTVSRDCFQLYMDERLKLKHYLKNNDQRISITTDTWTSIQQINYICITAHFIDRDWKLHKKILNFCPISSHKGESIGRAIETCLLEWGIDKVFTITVDNASSNDVAVEHLKRKFINWGTTIANGKYLHMRCIAHIINLIVQDGLKDLDPAIRWVRETVKYIRSSPARLKKFKECADSVQVECKSTLCLDVCTRWNSTYLMLSVAEKYEKAFERFELEDLYFGVEVDANSKGFVDWDVVRRTITMLGLFYDTTIRVSGSLYVTSNTFWTEISDLLSTILEWTRSDDSNVKGMGTKMKTKFDKYWGNVDRMNKIIFFAVVLDPREKFMAMEVSFCDIYGENEGIELFERVKMSLYDIFKEYKNMLQIESGHSSETSPSSNTSSNESVGNRPRGHYKLIAKKRRIESGHVHAKSELDMYLDEALQEDKDDFDILKWWKLNSERFSILSHMARDILVVPISIVASESTFSAGGRVLDPFRSSLTPKMVESLICAQDWIRKSNGLNVEEDITEVEKFENETLLKSLKSQPAKPSTPLAPNTSERLAFSDAPTPPCSPLRHHKRNRRVVEDSSSQPTDFPVGGVTIALVEMMGNPLLAIPSRCGSGACFGVQVSSKPSARLLAPSIDSLEVDPSKEVKDCVLVVPIPEEETSTHPEEDLLESVLSKKWVHVVLTEVE